MIERVARAIEGEIDKVELVSASPETIRHLRANRIARAAIAAMREPVGGMVTAGLSEIDKVRDEADAHVSTLPWADRLAYAESYGFGPTKVKPEELRRALVAMIDAALEEKP
jgi:hypothetical protein